MCKGRKILTSYWGSYRVSNSKHEQSAQSCAHWGSSPTPQ